MLSVLKNRTYRHLLSAQIIALIGTGLATVALGLLAYDIAGGNAGAVLGTALAIKMVAYIGIAPIIGAYADRLPRRAFLIAMDVIRAGVALAARGEGVRPAFVKTSAGQATNQKQSISHDFTRYRAGPCA